MRTTEDEKRFHAGDIVRCEDGELDYLIEIPGANGLWVNAVNEDWVRSGEARYCDECYGFFKEGIHVGATVVGHFGSGSRSDAEAWFAAGKPASM